MTSDNAFAIAAIFISLAVFLDAYAFVIHVTKKKDTGKSQYETEEDKFKELMEELFEGEDPKEYLDKYKTLEEVKDANKRLERLSKTKYENRKV